MKKIMVVACALALAAVSQAANVNWSFELINGAGAGGKGWGSAGLEGEKIAVQLIIGSTLSGGVIGDTVYNNTIQMDWEEGSAYPAGLTIAAMESGVEYYSKVIITSGGSTLESGIFGMMASALSGIVAPTWSEESDTYANLKDSTTSSLVGLSTFDADHGTFSASGWQTSSTPEPTSGLLLLLGMAGLALKRKRA